MEVDAITVFRVVLHARTVTACPIIKRSAVGSMGPARKWNEVTHHPRFWVLRRENMVDMRSFVKVEILGPWLPFKQMPRELEHVVGITSLTGVGAQPIAAFVRRAQVFVVTVATDCVGMVVDDGVPEKLSDVPIAV